MHHLLLLSTCGSQLTPATRQDINFTAICHEGEEEGGNDNDGAVDGHEGVAYLGYLAKHHRHHQRQHCCCLSVSLAVACVRPRFSNVPQNVDGNFQFCAAAQIIVVRVPLCVC